MKIDITERDDVKVITISGPMENHGTAELGALIEDIFKHGDSDVEIDLSNAEYIDSTGISLLLKLHKRQKEEGLNFSITSASERVESILKLCSLYDTLVQ